MSKSTMLAMTLAAAMLPATAAIAQAAPPPPPGAITGTRLEISAEGEVARTPDIATISAGVVTQSTTAAAAMAENADRMAATVSALRKAGVADRDIRTASINLSPQYRYGENMPPVITGYQASNQVSVKFRDVAKAGKVLDALVAAGANQINGPDLALDQPDAALDEARGKAVAAARAGRALREGDRASGQADRLDQRGSGQFPRADAGDGDGPRRKGRRHRRPARRAEGGGHPVGGVRAGIRLRLPGDALIASSHGGQSNRG